ncbi:MAG: hypothetical protein QOK05_1376 [Chloroflexota bacterium]|jgi:hypothetical protein|nr:hypothetical protein [Chloroflexota bacterium]
MHRSGTSAITRSLADSGLTLCPSADLLPANHNNAAGFWESQAIVGLNEALYRKVGATWDEPPKPDPGWGPGHRWEAAARPMLDWLFAPSPWVIKDPRLCLTLPFWLGILKEPPAIVLVLRHPLAIARSLMARDGLAPEKALALWHCHLAAALLHCVGLRTLVVSYEDVLERPATWHAAKCAFLHGLGIEATDGANYLGSTMDPAMQHWKERDGQSMTSDQQHVWNAAVSLLGTHSALPGVV